MDPVELQQFVDRELKRLPTPRAPQTLLPRVLAATVGRKAVPWYRRPWLEWPRPWQLASLVGIAAIAAGLSFVFSIVPPGLAERLTGGAPGRIGASGAALDEAATVVRLLWHVVIAPVAFYLLVLTVSVTLTCAAIWAALERFALGEASRQ